MSLFSVTVKQPLSPIDEVREGAVYRTSRAVRRTLWNGPRNEHQSHLKWVTSNNLRTDARRRWVGVHLSGTVSTTIYEWTRRQSDPLWSDKDPRSTVPLLVKSDWYRPLD